MIASELLTFSLKPTRPILVFPICSNLVSFCSSLVNFLASLTCYKIIFYII